MEELERYRSVQRWLTRLRKKGDSSNTRDMYLRSLRRFCEYAEMTPDMLIEERDKDIRSVDRFRRRRAEERLDGWFVELEKEGLARSSCVTYYNAVRSFYRHNYVELQSSEAPSSWPSKNKPGLSREELTALVQEAKYKPVYKAYILCQVQSGLGISDLLRLNVADVKDQLDSEYIHLRLLRGKRKELGWFDTFFGRMSTQALRIYLSTRKDLKNYDKLFPYTRRGVNRFLASLSHKTVVSFKVSSHDLRKFFATQLKMARVNDPAFNETLIEYWQGHSLGKVKGAYFVPPTEEQLRLYKLAEKRLEPNFLEE
jgi:integrase